MRSPGKLNPFIGATTAGWRWFRRDPGVVGAPPPGAMTKALVALWPAITPAEVIRSRLSWCAAGSTGRAVLRRVPGWPLPVPVDVWADIEREVRREVRLPVGEIFWFIPDDDPPVDFSAIFFGAAEPAAYARVLLDRPANPMSPRPGPGARCGIRWPIRLALLNVDGFAVDVSSACPGGLHRPARLAIGTILDLCEDIGASLHDASRPEGTPTDWVPMHGDLFPGNLRRFSGGRVVLLDWEAAGWAPPHADLVHYVRTASKGTELAARLPAHVRRGCAEAVRFWADRAGDLPEGAPRWMVRRRDAEDAAAAAILAS